MSQKYDITGDGHEPDLRLNDERISAAADALFGGNLSAYDAEPQLLRAPGSEADVQAYAYSAIVDRVSRTTSEGLLGMFATAQLNAAGRQAMSDLAHLLHFQWSAWTCNRLGIKRAMDEALAQLADDEDDEDDEDDGLGQARALAANLYEARNALSVDQDADVYAQAEAAVSGAFRSALELPERQREAFALLAEIDAIERSILRDREAGFPVDRYDWTAAKDRLDEGAPLYDVYHLMPPVWQHLDSLQKASISSGEYHATIITNILPRPGATILAPPPPPRDGKRSFWSDADPEEKS